MEVFLITPFTNFLVTPVDLLISPEGLPDSQEGDPAFYQEGIILVGMILAFLEETPISLVDLLIQEVDLLSHQADLIILYPFTPFIMEFHRHKKVILIQTLRLLLVLSPYQNIHTFKNPG